MSTLKIQETINKLPDTNFNIAEAMRQTGYKKSTTRSGQQYSRIRKHIEEYYNPDTIKADIQKFKAKLLKDNDNSNYARMLELQAKITGLSKENTQITTNIVNNDDILRLHSRAVKVDTKGSNSTDTQHTDNT